MDAFQHLLYAHVPLKENVASAERELIGTSSRR